MMQDKSEEQGYQLRPWLIHRANLEDFVTVRWQSKEKQTIKVLWVGDQQPGWEECSKLFQAWVDRNGKTGSSLSYSQLNQRFAGAMRKSNYFEELKHERSKHQTGNYRVYRMLNPEETQAKKEKKKNNLQLSRHSSTYDTQERLETTNLITDSQPVSLMASNMITSNDLPVPELNDTPFPHHFNRASPAVPEEMQLSLENVLREIGVDCTKLSRFHLTLVYDNVKVKEEEEVDFAPGCRFAVNTLVRIMAPDGWEEIPLPEYNGDNDDVKLALQYLTDGLVVKSLDDFCLHGIRKGKVFVGYSNCDCEGESFKKMNRNQETLLFSYSNYIAQVYSYLSGERKKRPICGVIISFGKKPTSHSSTLPVGLFIEPIVADILKSSVDSPHAMSDGILYSDDNSLDAMYHLFAEQLKV